MCGIAGIVCLEAAAVATQDRLAAMARTLRHRGPDDTGLVVDDGGGLLNTRLSIIDVHRGHQPIANEASTAYVVCNGEIYNHQHLRRRLQAAGHRFATESDTEVLLHLYEEYGEGMLEHLNGMFAFAIHDRARRRWLLARDRLGIKPLFFARHEGALLFASEIKAILACPGFCAAVDEEALELYLSLRYVPSRWTMFKGIRRLLPGQALTIDAARQVREWAYWEPWRTPGDGEEIGAGEAAEEVRALLSDAVRLRLMSDVPFGAFLSGGLDSSGVVALMARELAQPVQTFSIGFSEEARVDESRHALAVSRHCGTEHREVDCTADRVDLLPRLLWHFDEPFADPIIVPTHQVSALARQHVKVVLTGEGADEVFGGYARYGRDASLRRLGLVPAFLRRGLASLTGAAAPGSALTRALAMSVLPTPGRALAWVSAFEQRELLGLRPQPSSSSAASRLYEETAAQASGLDPVQTLMFCEQRLRLPECMLARTDRMTMAVSLEGRTPFLDHRLVEYALRLPSRLKVAGGEEKVVLKRALSPLLPASTTGRRKQGLAVPFALWTRHGIEASIRRILGVDSMRRRGLFRPAAVAGLLDRWGGHAGRHSQQIWSLLCLELWFRMYVDTGAGRLDPETPLREVA